jgi:hypothetical protein
MLTRARGTALTLRVMFPEQAAELNFKNPVLAAFSNAIWHCATAAQVCTVLNEAASRQASDPEHTAAMANLWGAYQAVHNWSPEHPPEEAPATYNLVYSNGTTQEIRFIPSEIDRRLQDLGRRPFETNSRLSHSLARHRSR